jgi:phage terminase large subunit-like protein
MVIETAKQASAPEEAGGWRMSPPRRRDRLEWPNGATCQLFSGEEPDQLRGPRCQLCYVDELAKCDTPKMSTTTP